MARKSRKPMVKNKSAKYKLGKYKSGKYKITKKGVRKTRHTKKRYTRKIGGEDSSRRRKEDDVLDLGYQLEEETSADSYIYPPSTKRSEARKFFETNVMPGYDSFLNEEVTDEPEGTLNIKDISPYNNILIDVDTIFNEQSLITLFTKLASSINAKDHYKLNLTILKNQYFKKLMTHSQYVTRTEGMKGVKQKFNIFITDVISNRLYQPFNGKTQGTQKIETLSDWIDVIELLYGFETQYKLYLVPEDSKPTPDIMKDLKIYCDTQSLEKRCDYPNPCCQLGEENEEIKNIIIDIAKQLATTKTWGTDNKATIAKRMENLIKTKKVATKMFEWLTSDENFYEKYKLFKKSKIYPK